MSALAPPDVKRERCRGRHRHEPVGRALAVEAADELGRLVPDREAAVVSQAQIGAQLGRCDILDPGEPRI